MTMNLGDLRLQALALLAGVMLFSAALLLSLPAFAADEDTQASVYLVFDPETGEFVTVHDTQGAAKAQETQEAIDSVAAADPSAGGGSGGGDAVAGTSDAAAQTQTSPALIAGLVVAALAVAGGAVFLLRRN